MERFTRRGHAPPGWHFVGVQVARRAAFDGVPLDAPSESVAQIYPRADRTRGRAACGAGSGRGRFDDIGTPASYLETCLRLSERDPAQLIESGAQWPPGARLSDTVCWPGAVVEDDVELDSCIVCSGACVPRGSRYHRSVLLPADAVPAGPHDYREGALTVSPIDS